MTGKLKIATLCGIGVAFLGVVFTMVLVRKNTTVLSIGVDSQLDTNFKVSTFLAPGENVSFNFKIDTDEERNIDFKIRFEGQKPGESFLYFKVEFNDVIYGQETFDKYTSDNKFVRSLFISPTINTGVFTFYIPKEVGNEAMNIDYNFNTFFEVRKADIV
ncbi:MAG: hypothetical protein SOV26_03725 [Candidatus Onthovivens sp.]|nr:hypothetical protein [Candidatus Onthovivens sp.]